MDATRNPSPRFASTTDPSTSRRGSAGPRAPPTPPGIEPARGSRGTDDFTARSSVGFDKPRRVARPARRFADGFADAVDARVGHVSDVRPSNRTSTRGVDTPREDARGGARVPDWKTTAKEATSVDREGASVDREAASVDVFVRPAPPAAPRFADFDPTRRAPRDLSLTSPKEPFDDSDRRLRSPAPRAASRFVPPRRARRRVAGSDETELRKRVDERLREHPHGVDTGTVDASEPGRKYAEFVRRLRAAGASSTDSRCSRRDSNARGEYGQAAYPAPGYYRARAPERPFPEAPVSLPTVRRAVAPGGCGDASVRRRRRDVARAARTVGKSGDDEDGREDGRSESSRNGRDDLARDRERARRDDRKGGSGRVSSRGERVVHVRRGTGCVLAGTREVRRGSRFEVRPQNAEGADGRVREASRGEREEVRERCRSVRTRSDGAVERRVGRDVRGRDASRESLEGVLPVGTLVFDKKRTHTDAPSALS